MLVAGCSGTPTLPFSLATQPLATAFKPLGGAWTTIDQVSHSERAALYEIPAVDGTIAIACRRTDGTVQVEELFATADELSSELYAPLVPWPQLDCTPMPSGPMVQIIGEVVQGAQVYIDDFQGSAMSGEPFVVRVPAGLHDLVAVGQAEVVVRHDESYELPITEELIDLDAGLTLGTLTVVTPFDGQNIATILTTVNGTVVKIPPTRTPTAEYVPPELLEPGDTQFIRVIEDPQGVESCELPGTAIACAFVSPTANLPDAMLFELSYPTQVPVGSDALSADFDELRVNGSLTDYRVAYASQGAALAATATVGWIRAHGAHVEFDSSFPGFQWPVLPDDSEHTVAIAQRADGAVYEANVSGP